MNRRKLLFRLIALTLSGNAFTVAALLEGEKPSVVELLKAELAIKAALKAAKELEEGIV